MARWTILVWAGLAVSAAALLIPGLLSGANRGSLFWILALLLAATAALAWLAMRGSRRERIWLVLGSALFFTLAVVTAILVIGFSLGQAPIVDVIGWPIVAVGATVVLIGAIWSLRAVEVAST